MISRSALEDHRAWRGIKRLRATPGSATPKKPKERQQAPYTTPPERSASEITMEDGELVEAEKDYAYSD
jgi:hypothetical protein